MADNGASTPEPDESLQERAAAHALEDLAAMAPGWDGPVPTRDNLHDICDGNMVVHGGLEKALGAEIEIDGEEGFAVLNAVYDRVLASDLVDTGASPERVAEFYNAVWGHEPAADGPDL